jgi:hypothetical protein
MSATKLKFLAVVAMLIASPATAAEGDPGTGKSANGSQTRGGGRAAHSQNERLRHWRAVER